MGYIFTQSRKPQKLFIQSIITNLLKKSDFFTDTRFTLIIDDTDHHINFKVRFFRRFSMAYTIR